MKLLEKQLNIAETSDETLFTETTREKLSKRAQELKSELKKLNMENDCRSDSTDCSKNKTKSGENLEENSLEQFSTIQQKLVLKGQLKPYEGKASKKIKLNSSLDRDNTLPDISFTKVGNRKHSNEAHLVLNKSQEYADEEERNEKILKLYVLLYKSYNAY